MAKFLERLSKACTLSLPKALQKTAVCTLEYDFKTWQWSEEDPRAQKEVKRAVALLKITPVEQEKLHKELEATFTRDHIVGYFETTVWPDGNVYFIDYNRFLPNFITTPPFLTLSPGNNALKGMTAHPGKAQGLAVLVTNEDVGRVNFSEGSVLITDNTDVRYLPLMKKAAAIVTERGGMLSHAAIIARELGVPCIVSCKGVTTQIKNGQNITVDADKGVILG